MLKKDWILNRSLLILFSRKDEKIDLFRFAHFIHYFFVAEVILLYFSYKVINYFRISETNQKSA